VLSSPHRSTVHKLELEPHDDPERWALTWRAYRRKYGAASLSRERALT
jgi:glycine dehydrogenase subunit 2